MSGKAERLVSVSEFARRHGVAENTVRLAEKTGRIPPAIRVLGASGPGARVWPLSVVEEISTEQLVIRKRRHVLPEPAA